MALLLAAAVIAASYPCEEAPYSTYAYCNTNLTPIERATALVAMMDNQEKVSATG